MRNSRTSHEGFGMLTRLRLAAGDTTDTRHPCHLYQVSETIYECFDRVLVMDEGLGIYYGPTTLARQYFHDLGYYTPIAKRRPTS